MWLLVHAARELATIPAVALSQKKLDNPALGLTTLV